MAPLRVDVKKVYPRRLRPILYKPSHAYNAIANFVYP